MNAREQIKAYWPVLKKKYTQKALVSRLKNLGVKISEAHLSNIHSQIVKDKKPEKATEETIVSISPQLLNQLTRAFMIISEVEFQKTLDIEAKTLIPIANSNQRQNLSLASALSHVALHEDGRLEIVEKVKFLTSAEHEIIEIGVRLNTFSQYFSTRKDGEFKNHIVAQLNRGVNMKYLMMNPDSTLVQLYFEDRAKVLSDEKDAHLDMKKTLKNLKKISGELNRLSNAGKMTIYTYDCLPSNHYLIVDGEHKQGKMLLSPYIYGITRANCPVFELYRQPSPTAFEKYWQSAQYIIQQAKEI